MKKGIPILLILLLLTIGIGAVYAGVQQVYSINWWTVDGGGGRLEGNTYLLRSTAGQPDAAPPLSGGTYTLYSGYWAGGEMVGEGFYIFLPLTIRN